MSTYVDGGPRRLKEHLDVSETFDWAAVSELFKERGNVNKSGIKFL